MANLYLIDRPFGQNGLDLVKSDPDAKVVLIQDGVYYGRRGEVLPGTLTYAVAGDVAKRGLAGQLASGVELIDYGQLVDLIFENKVINFA